MNSTPERGIRILLIPEPSLVVLVGPSGCGKSTFARRHFLSTEIVSSDACRAMIADDESDQSASADAFTLLRIITHQRLRRGRLTVIDATNVRRADRKRLQGIARQHGVPQIAIAFDLPLKLCLERNEERSGRRVPPEILQEQHGALLHSLQNIPHEGFRHVYILGTTDEIEATTIVREPLSGYPATTST